MFAWSVLLKFHFHIMKKCYDIVFTIIYEGQSRFVQHQFNTSKKVKLMISDQGRDSWWEEFFPDSFIYIFQAVTYFGMSQVFDTNVNPKDRWKRRWWFQFNGKENLNLFSSMAYPAAAPLCGLRRWYSTSSTVQTAPLTFSTRIKHLWRDKLWRTAFYIICWFFQRRFFWKGNKFDILTLSTFTL